MIYSIIAPMGRGKTLFASLYAKEYSTRFPDRKIYCNYHLNLQNVIYSPCMFLPYKSLEKCLIIYDDIYSSKSLDRLIGIIVNLSRKKDLDIILTGQYYTMIDKRVRILSTEILVQYDKNNDSLEFAVERSKDDDPKQYDFYRIREISKVAKGLYDTNEVVDFSTPMKIREEIKKFSTNIEELEVNVSLYTNNQQKIVKMTKELAEELGWKYSDGKKQKKGVEK